MSNKDRYRMISQMLTDNSVSKEILCSAIKGVGAAFEPPAFWSSIANNEDYSVEHRRISVFQLFKRHVRDGQNLSDLAGILDRPIWLLEENVTLVESLRGKVPVKWSLVDSIFAIRLGLPAADNSAIYLKLTGKQFDAKSFFRSLKNKSFDERQGKITILEIGYSEIV